MKGNRPRKLEQKQKKMLSGLGLNPKHFWYLRDEVIGEVNHSIFRSKVDGREVPITNIK